MDDEREVMKKEKRKLEYMLYDMLKASEANKDKFKRITHGKLTKCCTW